MIRCLKQMLVLGMVLALAAGPSLALTLNLPPNLSPTNMYPLKMKLINYDNGMVYPVMPVGASVGVTNNPVAGAPLCDQVLGKTPPAGGLGGAGWAPWAFGTSEDSWGVLQLTEIYLKDPVTNMDVLAWSSATSTTQLTAIFYGEEDFFIEQSDAETQTINGHGLHVDIYEDLKVGGTAFTAANGSLDRVGMTGYNTATDGTLILSMVSTPGFIHGPGVLGGLATEFESEYNSFSNISTGRSYFDVNGGSMLHFFNTSQIISPWGFPNADLFVTFDSYPTPTGPNPSMGFGNPPYDWLVESDDPYRGFYYNIPEPMTMAGLMLGLGSLVGYIRRRAA